jgi:hypothetical protein
MEDERTRCAEMVQKFLVRLAPAMRHYVEAISHDRILSTATHLSTDIDYTLVTEGEMKAALARRDTAGPCERDIYASYIHTRALPNGFGGACRYPRFPV